MKTTILPYFLVLIPLVVFDLIWLSMTLQKFYFPNLSHLVSDNPRYLTSLIFYLIFALGILFLVVFPALAGNYGFVRIFALGALLGLVTYGSYDFTNQSLLRNWPLVVTVVDIFWGMTLSAVVSTIATYLMRLF